MTRVQAEGEPMPQIGNCEDGYVKVTAEFGGIRKYKLLRWIPFTTGCRPKIAMTLRPKQIQLEVQSIAVDCYVRRPKEESWHEVGRGWSTNDARLEKKYEITLPALDTRGYHEYKVRIFVKLEHDEPCRIVGTIMYTGHVYSLESIWTDPLWLQRY